MKNQLILATLTLFLALTICSVATAAESIDNSTYSTTLGQATDQNSFVASSNSNETNSNPENLTNDDRTSITSTLALDPGSPIYHRERYQTLRFGVTEFM